MMTLEEIKKIIEDEFSPKDLIYISEDEHGKLSILNGCKAEKKMDYKILIL